MLPTVYIVFGRPGMQIEMGYVGIAEVFIKVNLRTDNSV